MSDTSRLSPLRSLVGYCYDFVKSARTAAQGYVHFRNGAARRGYLDMASLFEREQLLCGANGMLGVTGEIGRAVDAGDAASGSDFVGLWPEAEEPEFLPEEEERLTAFEALRRIHGLVRQKSHEVECVYGAFFLEGKMADGKSVLAPLVTVPVDVSYEVEGDSIVVSALHDSAALNVYALSTILGEAYTSLEESISKWRQMPLPLDLGEFQALLQTLQTVTGVVEVPRSVVQDVAAIPMLAYQGADSYPSEAGRFFLRRYAALAVVRKGDVYVLEDLASMAELELADFEGSLLERFAVGDEEDRQKGSPSPGPPSRAEGEVLFPFAANERQTRVARAIDEHDLVRVQGPPGTGKSQTIANLVCHLVARGKRVLVASQQKQAVAVVQEYLERLAIDFLPMTLVRGDRAAVRALKSRLDGLTAFVFSKDAEELREAAEEAEREACRLRERSLELAAELGRSLTFEGEPWMATGLRPGELAAEYAADRDSDRMAGEDVRWGQQQEVMELARQAMELAGELGAALQAVRNVLGDTAIPLDEQIPSLRSDLAELAEYARKERDICSRPEADEVRRLPLFPVRKDCGLDELTRLGRALKRQAVGLAGGVIAGEGAEDDSGGYPYEEDACRTDLKELDCYVSGLGELLALEIRAAPCRADRTEVPALAEALDVYTAGRGTWWRRMLPRYRRSARAIARALGRETLAGEPHLSPVRAAADADSLRRQLLSKYARVLSHLPVPILPERLDANVVRAVQRQCSQVQGTLKVRARAHVLARGARGMLGHAVPATHFLDIAYVEEALSQVQQAVRVIEADHVRAAAESILSRWHFEECGGTLQRMALAFREGDVDRLVAAALQLEGILRLVPTYRQLSVLLGGPLATWGASAERWVSRAAARSRDLPALLSDAEAEVRTCALRTELSAAERAAPRDASAISDEARDVEQRMREENRRAVEAYLHAKVTALYETAQVGNDVRYFSNRIQRGKRNYDAFLELKKDLRIFDSVLSVLPCWVATIQDVARVFPLAARLFDVVVIDEASQCSIPASLPLLMRSGKAIIVGDDKQLPCVEGRFVKQTFNRALLQKHKVLESLPRSDSFNACEYSLFDLAGSFTGRPVFLAEHFRCHPDIIAFSNARFYDGRLVVLTHGMDESLGSPTEIVPVAGAFDDPQTKTNRREAEAVVAELRKILDDGRYDGLTLGVCSPFRHQADLVWELILREFSDAEIEERRLIASTADGFQGDERDVVLYTFRFASNSHPSIFTLTTGLDGQQRMNVAVTRAKRRAVSFISASIEAFPVGLVRDYLRHAADPGRSAPEGQPWDSAFEQNVHSFLESRGLKVRPQVPACGYRLDFVLTDGDGNIAALEADGWEVHYPDGRLREEDIQRQRVLERAGWVVFRVNSRAFYRDPEEALSEVLGFFGLGSRAEEGDEVTYAEAEALVPPEASATPEEPESRVFEAARTVYGGGRTGGLKLDIASASLSELQDVLREVALEPGIETKRDDLFREAIPRLGLSRLGRRARARLQSAMTGLIRRGEFGYQGRELVWRLRPTPAGEEATREARANLAVLKAAGHPVVETLEPQVAPATGQPQKDRDVVPEGDLLEGAWSGDLERVRKALQDGARQDCLDRRGMTPLHHAAQGGHLAIVHLLLSAGAEVDAPSGDASTPLHLAAAYGHTEVIGVLLDASAHHSRLDEDGWSALHWACSEGHIGVVELLLAYAASAKTQATDGSTPLSEAARWGHKGIVDLLRQHGAAE